MIIIRKPSALHSIQDLSRLPTRSSVPREEVPEGPSTVEVTDYPRPAPPGEDHPETHAHHNNDEELPRKEKKHHDMKEQKARPNLPTRDVPIANKGFGAGGRIDQPAGKGLNINA